MLQVVPHLVATAAALAVALWLASLARRDASIVDAAWGPMSFATALVGATAAEAWSEPRTLLLMGLLAAWSGRLAGHLLPRNLREGEDPRYAAMREKRGAAWGWVSLFQVFLLQAGLMLVVVLVVVQPIVDGGAIRPLAWAGAALVLAAIALEATADAQLAAFRRDPANRGRVMDRGLWAWSRHPNYFAESVVWWGFWVVALGVGGAWWTVASPLVMTVLLLQVSGVPLLEARLRSTRPGYAAYAARTSAFVPRPPRRDPARER